MEKTSQKKKIKSSKAKISTDSGFNDKSTKKINNDLKIKDIYLM